MLKCENQILLFHSKRKTFFSYHFIGFKVIKIIQICCLLSVMIVFGTKSVLRRVHMEYRNMSVFLMSYFKNKVLVDKPLNNLIFTNLFFKINFIYSKF